MTNRISNLDRGNFKELRSAARFLAFSVIVLLAAPAASAQVQIENLRIGFGAAPGTSDAHYKIGNWAPAAVTVKTGADGFDGRVEISTADSDDVQAIVEQHVRLAPHTSSVVRLLAKPGKALPAFHVRLRDANDRTVDRETFESRAGHVAAGAPQRVTMIVTLGRPAGLDVEAIVKRPGYLRENLRVAHTRVDDLPDRWFGFEAVDYLVLCASDAAEREPLSAPTTRAIETWVRQGGHLVLSQGATWESAPELFRAMLPATMDRVDTVQRLNDLENFVGQSAPAIQLRAPLRVPHFSDLRGKLLAGVRELPLAVRGSSGLGTVTLLALDFQHEAFQSWDGAPDFWIKLLELRKPRETDRAGQGAWGQRVVSDLSSHLHVALEEFDGVTIVPFHWVAAFAFVYILLIGPADYWLVRRLLKRMEWTWVTLPLSVAAAVTFAYFTANALKGESLRVNKVDLIDVDSTSGAARGTTWFALFSPTMKNFSIQVVPDRRWAGEPDASGTTPSIVVSWLGVAEDAIGGTGRKGGVELFRRGYRFGPESASVSEVPVSVWSSKGFTARWVSSAGSTLQTDLRSVGADRLRGTIANRTGVDLEDCLLAFGGRVYPLGKLSAIGGVDVHTFTPEDLRGHVARRRDAFERLRELSHDDATDRKRLLVHDLLLTMMFRSRMTEENQFVANNYFRDVDLSHLLDLQRAIFVARVATNGSQLILDGSPAVDTGDSTTLVRVILPVASAPVTTDILRDPSEFRKNDRNQ